MLLAAGAPAGGRTTRGLTALHMAGSCEAAQMLLDAGAPLDAQDSVGRTPLVFRLWEARDAKTEEERAASSQVAALLVRAAAGMRHS